MSNDITLSVPVSRTNGQVDVEAFVASAREIATSFAEADAKETDMYLAALDKVLAIPEVAKLETLKVPNLRTMATRYLPDSVLLNDGIGEKMEAAFKSWLKGQNDKFIYVEKGKGAGFHVRANLTAERITALTKTVSA